MEPAERIILFAGAGPGDPELLTLKGKKALEEADLVLYAGSLVNREILAFCRPCCEKEDSSGLSLEEQ
ncbi:MAG: SAM-dependent methyltransferase, partial [Synergistaceae bacterium]|nr:SAM-dependent methyltransferase [Synergistaceae bacterium]